MSKSTDLKLITAQKKSNSGGKKSKDLIKYKIKVIKIHNYGLKIQHKEFQAVKIMRKKRHIFLIKSQIKKLEFFNQNI